MIRSPPLAGPDDKHFRLSYHENLLLWPKIDGLLPKSYPFRQPVHRSGHGRAEPIHKNTRASMNLKISLRFP
jgi:hypothetical protein